MEFLKKPIFYVIILVGITIAATWNYFADRQTENTSTTDQPEQTTTVSNLSNLDPADFDDFTRGEYALATQKSAEVDASYKLSMIEVAIGRDLTAQSVNTRYVFSSAKDTKNNWMITISTASSSFVRALIPKDDYGGELTAIDTASWKYNYVTALQLAEKNGGLSWRESKTMTGIQLFLKNDNSKLVWIVQYNGTDENKIIKLDASTGTVISQ